MADPDRVDGAPGLQAPLREALAALRSWARRRRSVWTLKLFTPEELVAQIESDIKLYYSGRHDNFDGLTPAEVAQGLAESRFTRAVQFDQALVEAEKWISRRNPPPECERTDIMSKVMESILTSFREGTNLEDPDGFGVTVAQRRWNDAFRRHYRGLQIVPANPMEPERDDEPPSALATALDPASDVEIEFLLARLDRARDQERRQAEAQEAMKRLSPPGAAYLDADRPSRCPEHRHRRRHVNTDHVYIDMDLAARWVVSYFADPHRDASPAGWDQLRWAALGSVNPARYGTWGPVSKRRSTNAQAARRSHTSLCLLWRLGVVIDCFQEVGDVVIAVAPVELRQALVTWVATPARRRKDRVPLEAVEDAYVWCEELVEGLLGRADADGPVGPWGTRRGSEAVAYRHSADVLRRLLATDGVPAELKNDVEILSARLAHLGDRLSGPRELPA